MRKLNTLKCLLAYILTLTLNTMNAQPDPGNSPSLSLQQQNIAAISACTAVGNMEQLKIELHAGLDAGLTVNEIKSALEQLYAYCGFPRSLNAITLFMQVMEERKAKGITDKEGKSEAPPAIDSDKYERGRKVLEVLTGQPQSKPAKGFGEFSPVIDRFLKEHLFADIFDNDVLSYQQRELVTIAALSAMPGVEPQLQAHLTMGKNTGLTDDQLIQVADLIEKHVSKTQANVLRKLLSAPVVPVVEADMMVRIAEIEVDASYLEEYIAILKEEAAASVKIEPGVLAIFPMYQKDNPTQIRLVEIYANQSAYQSHLKTPHFQHYKTTTLKMVKSLNLVAMEAIDVVTMQEVFKKLK